MRYLFKTFLKFSKSDDHLNRNEADGFTSYEIDSDNFFTEPINRPLSPEEKTRLDTEGKITITYVETTTVEINAI